MDHIYQPRNPTRARAQILYLVTAKYKYDGLGFSDFPKRTGFDIDRLKRAELQPDDWYDALSYLQAWGFFGMLAEVLSGSGLTIKMDDFIWKRDGQQFITTKILPYYLRLWASCESALDSRAKEESLSRTDRRLAEIHRCINGIAYAWGLLAAESSPSTVHPGSLYPPVPLEARDTLLSIMILGEYLSFNRYFCYGIGTVRPITWTKCWFLEEWMLDAGWCPYEIAMVEDKFIHNNACSYYLSLMDRSYIEKNHNSCTWEACVVDHIDVKTYRTKHTETPCDCIDAVEDSVARQVRLIVLEHNIPVLTLFETRDKTTPCEIKVRQSGPRIRYVAISHVWSDGLGNHQRNSLPMCQMMRLQTLVDNLYDKNDRPVPFWVDTICVPLEPLERKMAIAGIKRTYEEADKVLVLDSTLQGVNDERSPTEILKRIATSSWLRRLWTFQEGALSRNLYFQFANKALTHSDIGHHRQKEFMNHVRALGEFHCRRRAIRDHEERRLALKSLVRNMSEAEDPIFFEANNQIHNVRNWFQAVEKDCERLDALVENIKWRTTSRPEDEVICLANLLGRSITNDLLSCSHEERMKWLFSSLSSMAACIIFHDRPRIQDVGYRWIPRSILNWGNTIQIRGDTKRASVSPDGLKVTYPGLLLFPGSDFYESKSHLPIYLAGNNQARAYLLHVIENPTVARATYRGLQLAMMFEDFDDRSMEYVPKARAILVVVTKKEQNALLARIELPLLFELTTKGSIPSQVCHVVAEALPQHQTWLVG